jgi:hypothetical protein
MKELLIATLIVFGFWQGAQAHDHDDDFTGFFYTSLDPHGEWILVDRGLYAWRPLGIHAGWRPYTVGRWMWTSYGWYWVSAEPWGWATYHYGRWFYDDFYGWVWLPGSEWAPAWVEWRYGGDMIGWAPLPPYAIFSVSVGITFSTGWLTPYEWWSFVDCRHMGAPSVHRYVYRPRYNERYVGRTRPAGSVRYHEGVVRSGGPERVDVERRGRIRLSQAEVVEGREMRERVAQQGGGTRLEVYRPRIEERDSRGADRPGRIGEGRIRLDADALRPDGRRVEGRDADRAPAPRERMDTRRPDERSTGTGSGEPRSGRELRIDPRRVERRDLDRAPAPREGVEEKRPQERTGGTHSGEERVRTQREKAPPPDVRPDRRTDRPPARERSIEASPRPQGPSEKGGREREGDRRGG